MKKYFIILVLIAITNSSYSQNIVGGHTSSPTTNNTYITEKFVVKGADNQYPGAKVTGTTYYDSTKQALKIYHAGNKKAFATNLNTNNYSIGIDSISGDSTLTIFKILHGYTVKPIFYNIVPQDTNGVYYNARYFLTADTAWIYIHYTGAKGIPTGTKNAVFKHFYIKQ